MLDEVESMKITTIVDNNTLSRDLQSTWGLSILVSVTVKDKLFNILMDTSGSVPTFFHNIDKLGINLQNIDAIFISHRHGDHCGALPQVLQSIAKPVMVYVPSFRFFDTDYLQKLGGIQVATDKATVLFPGGMSTGDVGRGLSEHALIVNVKNKGLMIITGCSHPGVVEIIRKASELSEVSRVYGIMGGFHISGSEAKRVANYLKEIAVKMVSPAHCTDKEAKEIIKQKLEKEYISNGSGLVITI
ncbi:MAG: MBL fold metallo-hydrolase [Candidatus Freyarchaeota archaeon]|nr:MBL fold metallo-hydrolase [Candidatus Jordarchaeia archaeon]MBS7278228.1 MBL fold metallo-hydrolase [Candidatus Jordarchaeia archaeon]